MVVAILSVASGPLAVAARGVRYTRAFAPTGVCATARSSLTGAEQHDPAHVHVPPYLPDTPLVRRDWAREQDLITMMDKAWIPRLLKQLEEDKLADDTIVFFFADHGVGLPRAKQFVYDSGMQVPLIIYFPPKWRHLAPVAAGATVDRLVSFVDFGPTVLSLAGVPVPEHMQGKAFLGGQMTPPRQYVYGIRDRMDERYDMTRTVRGDRFKYHRNYMPYRPHFPWLEYMEKLNTSKELRRSGDGVAVNRERAITLWAVASRHAPPDDKNPAIAPAFAQIMMGEADLAKAARKRLGDLARSGNRAAIDAVKYLAARENRHVLLLDVPHILQAHNYCAPASAAMILRYQGIEVSQFDIHGLCPNTKVGDGVYWSDLLVAVGKCGGTWQIKTHPATAEARFSDHDEANQWLCFQPRTGLDLNVS